LFFDGLLEDMNMGGRMNKINQKRLEDAQELLIRYLEQFKDHHDNAVYHKKYGIDSWQSSELKELNKDAVRFLEEEGD
jgi:uncharacterized protein (DUF305 family)